MVGFIMLHRDLLDWEWYQSSETFRVFVHLILRANYSDKKWQGTDVKRGQFITSNNHLANELSLSIQQVRTALKRLESGGYITRKTTNKFTLITIVNYNNRQSTKTPTNSQKTPLKTNKQHSANIQSTTTKKSNKENKVNKLKIEERIENFKKQVFEHSNYSKDILTSFFNYWSELNSQKNKMRFEKDDYFDLKIRLEKWLLNEKPKLSNSNNIKNTNSNR
ncbi:hypothetical protein GCM10022291_18320 [Postechiella marina]|uniref:Helix-turn-helix domain-containing protein n=1 Tax=Postechiella marina TaxID=943941 RepID=A0ABP8C8R4_9FLAO